MFRLFILFIMTLFSSAYAVDLEWFPIEGVKKYKVEIATDPEFQNIIRTQVTNQVFYTYVPDELGLHYWRVKGLNKNKVWGGYSAAEKIKVIKRPKEILITFGEPSKVGNACRMPVKIVLDGKSIKPQPGMLLAIKQDGKLYKFTRWSVNLSQNPLKIHRKFKYYLVQGKTILARRDTVLAESFKDVSVNTFKLDIENIIRRDPSYQLLAVYDEENDRRYNDLSWIKSTYRKQRQFKVYYKGPDCSYYKHTYIPETNNFDFRTGLYYASLNYQMDNTGIPSGVNFLREENTAGVLLGVSYLPAKDYRYVDEVSLDVFMNYNFNNAQNNLVDSYLKFIKKNVFGMMIMGIDGHAVHHYLGFESDQSTSFQPVTDFHTGPFVGISKSFLDFKIKLYGGYLGLINSDNSNTWYVKGHYEKLTGYTYGIEFRYYKSSIPIAINLPSSTLEKNIEESIMSLGLYYIF
jgi:hypothetical protein